MAFRLLLRQIRKSSGMTQSELASKVGVSERILGSWERGETGLTLDYACKCAVALGCTPNDLCGWYEDHPRESRSESTNPYAQELMDCFDGSSQEGRRTIINVARSMLETTGGAAQRGDARAEETA